MRKVTLKEFANRLLMLSFFVGSAIMLGEAVRHANMTAYLGGAFFGTLAFRCAKLVLWADAGGLLTWFRSTHSDACIARMCGCAVMASAGADFAHAGLSGMGYLLVAIGVPLAAVNLWASFRSSDWF